MKKTEVEKLFENLLNNNNFQKAVEEFRKNANTPQNGFSKGKNLTIFSKNIYKTKMFKLPPQKFDFLSIGESQSLINEAKGTWKDMILLILKTGLRISEVLALSWSDINLTTKIMAVRNASVNGIVGSTKSNKVRYTPLTDEVCEMMKARRRSKGLVFYAENYQPLKTKRTRNSLHATCKRIELRKIGWHVLKHTFASHLTEAGAPLKAIQELLGHSDIKMTMRYAHLSPSTLKSSIKLLEKKDKVNSKAREGGLGQENIIFGQHMGNRVINQEKIAQTTPKENFSFALR